MADVKISQLPSASLPLTGAEIFPLVQNGVTVKADLNAIPTSTVLNARDYGATGDGTTNDTAALKAFFNACISTNNDGFIPAGTYIVTLGQLVFDNNHVDTPFPTINTAGASLTIFKAAANTNNPFLKISNGVPISAQGKFWKGGGLGGITFEANTGSVAGLPLMNGLVLRGIEDAQFGSFFGIGLGGNTVLIERLLFGGSNPDPAHVNRCQFEIISGVNNAGASFYNDNYRGFAFCNISNVFANGNSNGCFFGLGASNTVAKIGASNCLGWAIGDQSDSLGGASNSFLVDALEIDNCQNGVDTQNTSESFTIQSAKIIHRYNSGLNASLLEGYWPRTALRIGSSFRAVRDIYFNSVQDRIEAGGTLPSLGSLADFMNAGGNLSQVYISRNVSDEGSIGVTTSNWYTNFSANSYNVYYRATRATVLDTTQIGNYILARNSGAVAVPTSGFGGAGSWMSYNTILAGNTANYNTTTYEYTAPATGLYRIQATLALTLAASTRVRMGVYSGTSLIFSFTSYATTTNPQNYSVSGTTFLNKGAVIKISADQNGASPVTPGGTAGGANDSFLSIEMI